MFNKLTNKNAGFTLVEIMIVVAIIALLAAIAVPGFLRARKRSQAAKILNDLRMIDSAVDQYAIETNKSTGSTVAVSRLDELPQKGLNPLHHRPGPLRRRLRHSNRGQPAQGSVQRVRHAFGRCRHLFLVAIRPVSRPVSRRSQCE